MQKGCWDLIEVNCAANEARNLEWNLARAEPQEIRGGKEINWEESSLAKFSYFLGFPTEGLEKEILGFFYQDQKEAAKDTQQTYVGEVEIRKGAQEAGVFNQL